MIGLFDKICSTQRPTLSESALGTARSYGGNYLENVPCALQQRSGLRGSARELGDTSDGLSSTVVEWRIWFPIGTDIRGEDRVTVNGQTYEVIIVDPDVAGVGHHGHADLREVRA